MQEAALQPRKPILARVATWLGTFNIVYGSLGLLSAAALRFLMPQGMNPLPDGAMVASSLASLWILVQGVLLRVYGPSVLVGLPSLARRAATRLRAMVRRP